MDFVIIFAIMVALYVGGCLLWAWYSPRAHLKLIKAETAPLPESVTVYRRGWYVILTAALVVLLIGSAGALSGWAAFSTKLGLFYRFAFGAVSIVLCLFVCLTVVLAIRDLVLYSQYSPWARPVLELSVDSIRVFGTLVAQWSQMDEPVFYGENGPAPGLGGIGLWLLIPRSSLSKGKPTLLHAYPALSWEASRRKKISYASFVPVPLYGLTIAQWRLRIFIRRYWAEVTGLPYQPDAVESRYPQSLLRDSKKAPPSRGA